MIDVPHPAPCAPNNRVVVSTPGRYLASEHLLLARTVRESLEPIRTLSRTRERPLSRGAEAG
jgi:hypothetical protein